MDLIEAKIYLESTSFTKSCASFNFHLAFGVIGFSTAGSSDNTGVASCRVFSAIIRRFFDENQLPFLHLVVLPPHFLLHAEGGAADPVAQGVVEVIKQPVFKINSDKKKIKNEF